MHGIMWGGSCQQLANVRAAHYEVGVLGVVLHAAERRRWDDLEFRRVGVVDVPYVGVLSRRGNEVDASRTYIYVSGHGVASITIAVYRGYIDCGGRGGKMRTIFIPLP